VVNNVWLLDIGNTKTKVIQLCLESGAESVIVVTPLSNYDSPLDWLSLHSDNVKNSQTRIFFASVHSDNEDEIFTRKLIDYACQYTQIHTESCRFGLLNAYQQPSKMGVDRWLAMLGAKLITDNAFMVIDAGTAVTLDAVIEDAHIGGWIVPGLTLSKDALMGATRRVCQAALNTSTLNFGTDTEDCVHLGSLAQLSGLLLTGIQVMQQRNQNYDVVITGGDSLAIQQCLEPLTISPRYIRVKNLVFVGMLRYWFEAISVKNVQKLAQSLII
jgi:type III pantothenate kinase